MLAMVMEMLMRNLSDILVLDNAFGKENIIEPLPAGNGPTNSLGSSDAQKFYLFLTSFYNTFTGDCSIVETDRQAETERPGQSRTPHDEEP